MDYAYWKQFDDKNYSFEEAVDVMLNESQNDIEIRVHKPDSYKEIRIYKKDLPKDLDDLELPLWAANSLYWRLYVPDYDMESAVNEIRDYLNDVYVVDSRFYNVSKMQISDIFNQFEINVFDDDIRMKILLWLRDNDMIKKRY